MFMVKIWVYCGPPKEYGHPNIFQILSILGTQFLNPD